MPIQAFSFSPLRPVAGAAALLCALSAAAQTAPATPSTPETTQAPAAEATLPTVSVRSAVGTADLLRLPASANVVEGRELQDRQMQVNLSEALGSVPGLTLNNRNNYAQDLQLSVRGYGARSTFGVRGVRLYVDGIPATMPDGQGQTSNVDISSLERVEVLRGPYSALYGNASGGVLSFYTEDPQGPLKLETGVSVGSDGQQRYSLKASGQTEGGMGYVLSTSRFMTDGYREHSAADRNLLNAKLVIPLAHDDKLTLVANHTRGDAQDPQGLTMAQWQADPRQASSVADQYNTRKSLEQQQLGATYDLRINAQQSLSLSAYYGHRSMLQYQSIPKAPQLAPGHAGGVIDMARDYAGARLVWVGEFDSIVPLQLSAGLDLQQMTENRQGYENFVGDTYGLRGQLRRDEKNKVSSTDPFVQARWQLAPRWSLDTGLRYSRVRFSSDDYYITPGNGDDSGSSRHSKLLPVASLSYQLSPQQTVYASVGRGFETPSITEMSYRNSGSGLNTDLRPTSSTQWELGYRQQLRGDALRGLWSAALFQSHSSDEIVTDQSAGGRTTYRNAGKTRRQGLELSAQLDLMRDWQLRAAYTWLDARFREDSGSGMAGQRLPGLARHNAYLGADWHFAPAWTVGMGVQASSNVQANDANTQAAPGYATTALSLGYRAQIAPRWTLAAFARVNNVFDKNYIGSVIVNDGNQRYFESAMGRNWASGVNVSYQF